MEANIHPLSFDSESGTSPQVVYTGLVDSNHGTRCAGIIGAVKDNEIGLAGVAPNCKLMSISNSFEVTPFLQMKIADGMDWAWQNGADIISNSWYSPICYTGIDEAINNAVTQGRNGKGCVVVFASGNANTASVYYPANLPNVIAVGAIDYDGNRAFFSNYGSTLDIVAPGVNISTTKGPKAPLQYHPHPEEYLDTIYRRFFGGTSAACPHVSGVAALILSVNPYLSGQQVRDIIESTAQKVGGYNYQNTLNRPNGTWHAEMGYGLVDAYAAVVAAREAICNNNFLVVNKTITQDTIWNSLVRAIDTITIQNGATLTIVSRVNCENNTKILIHPGGKLVIDGGTLTSACSDDIWQGIVVLGDPNQPQLPQYQGTVELKNGAVIEHALCAISAAPAGDYVNSCGDLIGTGDFGGGIIQADSAIFRNNLQAIEYAPYEYQPSPGNTADNVGKFVHCTFTINENNHFSAVGKTLKNHVTMWGVRGVTFEACIFENAIGILQHSKIPPTLTHGIHTLDAGFKIINHCKKGGSTGVDCPCLSTHTTPTIFRNLNVGILSENTGQPYYIHIDQSEFQDLGTGVHMNDQTNYRLTRCNFSNNSPGLSTSNSSGYKIEENKFYTVKTSSAGIFMNNSGSAENKIYKNYFNNLAKSISVNGINGPELNGPYYSFSGLQFICNEFNNNDYDIHISQNATVRTNQGSLSAGANNKFVATDTSSIYSLSSQTITYYHSPGGNYAPQNPTSNIIVVGNAGIDLNLPDLCIASSKSTIDSLEQYKMMQQQYDQLLTQLDENHEVIQELLVLSDAMRELSDHAISKILSDSILYVENLKQWYEAVRTPIAKYCLAEVYFSEKKYEQAENVLKEIPAMFVFNKLEIFEHENYMQFYNFKKQLQLSERNWMQLTESEIAHLQQIAEATNGRSAGMAKGVLCFFYDICYENEIEEESGEDTQKSIIAETQTADTQHQTYEISVYPNPTRSEMTVTLNNPAVKIIKMEVYDIYGKNVSLQTVNNFYETLKMNKLAQGIYILKVQLDNGDVVIKKIVKL